MLPHRRADSPLKSTSVSRVGSFTRLNQPQQDSKVAGASNHGTVPSTPSGYVTSSLNPLKTSVSTTHLPPNSKIRTNEELEAFNRLPIVQHLDEFRNLLDKLSEDISSFKEDTFYSTIEEITKVNNTLEQDIADLSKHEQRKRAVKNLSSKNKNLDDRLKSNLKELLKYRNELKKLPTAPSYKENYTKKNSASNTQVTTKNILEYSMKLAKFTKAPAAMGNMPFQIHPNNYIWPAEDSLRRGVLAMSSLQGDEIVQSILGTTTTTDSSVAQNDEEEIVEEMKKKPSADEETSEEKVLAKETKSSSSSSSYTPDQHNDEPKKTEPVETVDLDLDLFDPDDEYSD
ncbi:MED4 [Candida oxycetoniae]|uniref:Mediator of RNA polymerase II transcription subunit 4 n=1 Tax=Candida oxycetoniae TaxID=497107 RepID=A0AAI9WWP4_9ASCO|nr:MED4 [Candida oxycetoniae]KAI3403461.2 MED4 [Candida oxycetoniae]